MKRMERVRDAAGGAIRLDQIAKRMQAGWRLVSLEWEREAAEDAILYPADADDVPYGLRVSEDCLRLELQPEEHRILLLMMDLIVQDFPLSHVASDLNEKGFRTRAGHLWSQVSVFEMLPRLIEVGPKMFRSKEWSAQRQSR